MTGGAVIREARLRAGLSQADLATRIGRDRTQIARWERDAVSPSFDVVVQIAAVCGFDLSLDLHRSSPSTTRCSPSGSRSRRRSGSSARSRSGGVAVDASDPIAILRALDAHFVAYVLIGDMAEVANGSPLGFGEVEVAVSLKESNLERLEKALVALGGDAAVAAGLAALPEGGSVVVRLPTGPLRLTPVPPGTRGYDDVRRKASRVHLARGLRVPVADVRDLVRIENAGEADRARVAALQWIEALDRSRGAGLGR